VAWKRSAYRWISVNVAAAALAASLFFGYQFLKYRMTEEFEPKVWSEPHDILGDLTRPNQTLHWTRKTGFRNTFDIIVTTNGHGFRVTPPAPGATKSIVFFGCSYTFGPGVEDRETYPYLVGEALGGSVATYNISFNGWGPHEMLAALQSGLVETMVKEPPELVMFLTITDHVRRVIGREAQPWMARSPRFVLEDGMAIRKGTFADDPLRKQHSNSDPGYWSSFTPEDFQLYGAVVGAARDEVARKFPGARFEVVLWETDRNPARGPVVEALRANGITAHVSDEFLADNADGPFRYMISEQERHPNPEGLRLLARFVETRLFNKD